MGFVYGDHWVEMTTREHRSTAHTAAHLPLQIFGRLVIAHLHSHRRLKLASP